MSESGGSFCCIPNTVPANALDKRSDWFLTGRNVTGTWPVLVNIGAILVQRGGWETLALFGWIYWKHSWLSIKGDNWRPTCDPKGDGLLGEEWKRIKYKLPSSCLIPKSKFKSTTARGAGPDTFHQHDRKQIGWYDYSRFFRWDTSVLQ